MREWLDRIVFFIRTHEGLAFGVFVLLVSLGLAWVLHLHGITWAVMPRSMRLVVAAAAFLLYLVWMLRNVTESAAMQERWLLWQSQVLSGERKLFATFLVVLLGGVVWVLVSHGTAETANRPALVALCSLVVLVILGWILWERGLSPEWRERTAPLVAFYLNHENFVFAGFLILAAGSVALAVRLAPPPPVADVAPVASSPRPTPRPVMPVDIGRASLQAVAPGIPLSDEGHPSAQTRIDAAYRREAEAIRLKYLDGVFDDRAPDFRAYGFQGQSVNIGGERTQMQGLFDGALDIRQDYTLVAFSQRDPRHATCHVKEVLSSTWPTSIQGTVDDVAIRSESLDDWEETDGDWKMVATHILKSDVTRKRGPLALSGVKPQ